jgi:hypothetical protein
VESEADDMNVNPNLSVWALESFIWSFLQRSPANTTVHIGLRLATADRSIEARRGSDGIRRSASGCNVLSFNEPREMSTTPVSTLAWLG